jgi:AcrR family transcriptional regulator
MKSSTTSVPAPTGAPGARQAVIDAAVALLVENGRPASLEAVAAAAGVSKGGLLHHFPSQSMLAVAICVDSAERLRNGVLKLVTSEDVGPGRLLRAYVRALLGESPEAAAAIMHFAALTVFKDVPGVQSVIEDDAKQWREAFTDDGIETGVWLSVRFAAEGVVPCLGTAYLSDGERYALRQYLLSFARTA